MNPIFSRRYKGSSRPNIMPTAAKRQSYMKSMSTAGNSSSSSSGSGSTFSMGDSAEESYPSSVGDLKSSPDREVDYPQLFTKSKGKSSRGGGGGGSGFGHSPHHRSQQMASPGGENASRLLAQELLASKQNMLAQVSLTPHENRQRAKLSDGKEERKLGRSSLMKQSFSMENFGDDGVIGKLSAIPKSPTVHDIVAGGGDMTLCDLDPEDEELMHRSSTQGHYRSSHTDYYNGAGGSSSVAYAPIANSRISRPNLNQCISKELLDMKIWRELRQVVVGNTNFHEGWIGQGFVFDTKIPFGMVQKKGGPCGVLAVVQSLLLRNLLFGSPFSAKSELKREQNKKVQDIIAYLSGGGGEEMEDGGGDITETLRKNRVECLVDAVAEIIWTCGEYQNGHRSKKDRVSLIMFSDYRIQPPEVIRVKGRVELQHFLQNSIHRFDCITLVYSAVLTRGISGVKEDMDFENCSLIGQHGYCSQELINLLAIGRAISNTFDNEIELDGKVLKGIPEQCDIGLLSLFEHYDSIKVGSNLKCPSYPVWMICSESHFSVLFSCEIGLCNGGDDDENNSFDLFYYDGLSRQDKVIRLSICLSGNNKPTTAPSFSFSSYNTPTGQNQFSKFQRCDAKDDDLVPPLEKCIRTKWPGASVNWNDTEPIL